MADTVLTTVKDGLCVCCGACARVCAAGAIREVYRDGLFVPEIDAAKCTSCGLCRRVCPGAPTDVAATYGRLDFDGPAPLGCYRVHSTDDDARSRSASGGFVTAFVSGLLERGLYSRAYVLDFERFDGRKAEVSAVSETGALSASTRSKYIPAGIGEVISAVREGRIAGSVVVCTPCQLLAIRKAMRLFSAEGADVLFVGLFCESVMDYRVYGSYEEICGPIASLHFKDKRAGGWPGDTLVECADGGERIVDRSVRMAFKKRHLVGRCRFCFDKLNSLADISAGDCYVPGAEDPKGVSTVLVRTERGARAFEACRTSFAVRAESFEAVKAAQLLDARRANLGRALRETGLFVDAPALRPPRPPKLRAFNVLIDVEGFANRGDQLMLDACLRQLRARISGATVCVPEKAFLEDPSWCMARQIRPIVKFERKCSKRLRQRFRRFVSRRILGRMAFLLPDEIDLVLFAAGFNYGDQLAECYTEGNIADEVAYYASFSKPGRRFVLMPQAFGPFRTPAAKEKMLRLFPYVDLAYAREPVSYANMREILPDAPNLREAPDFTCLCEPAPPSLRLKEKSYVALVPNMRMVDRTAPEVSRGYMSFCTSLVRAVLDHGESVVLVNHEGRDDETLCHAINARFGNSLTILSGLSGAECKAALARAKLVVSSRFHGVVSGLVEGVPTLCTSWSHKYGELLKEHGRPGSALDVRDPVKAVATVLDALERPSDYASAPGCVETVRKRTQEMWDEIFSILPQDAFASAQPKYRLW